MGWQLLLRNQRYLAQGNPQYAHLVLLSPALRQTRHTESNPTPRRLNKGTRHPHIPAAVLTRFAVQTLKTLKMAAIRLVRHGRPGRQRADLVEGLEGALEVPGAVAPLRQEEPLQAGGGVSLAFTNGCFCILFWWGGGGGDPF